MWRWDQGRLLYFQFDVLRDIAKTLVKFDNADIKLYPAEWTLIV